MAINRDSNGYTYVFAIAMVVVVGSILASLAMGLKDLQQENMKQEKMRDILVSVQVMEKDQAMTEAPGLFNEYITKRVLLDAQGTVLAEESGDIPTKAQAPQDPFNIDTKKQYRSFKANVIKGEDMKYPLYECSKDGKTFYIVPMVGTGLWGPIWGYVAFKDDLNTIYGATFDHKTETPGLGAEIKEAGFQQQFIDKTIFNGDEFVSISVLKGGGGKGNPHAVDGITGGTITSDGVNDMIKNTLAVYAPYFKQN
jgi:Na+-transporting NADH:ubiquinone oxidoreductase subunit C